MSGRGSARINPNRVEKLCPVCSLVLPRVSFGSDKRRTDRLSSICLPCKRLKDADRKLISRYGITRQEYDQMVRDQNGLCAICQEAPLNQLWVDHNHDTNKVRALLCAGCNTLVGFLETNPNRLSLCLGYIDKWRNL